MIDTEIEKHLNSAYCNKMHEQQDIQDLFHVIISCQTIILSFMIDVDKPEFFPIMKNLTIKELKQTSEFVQKVEMNRTK